MLLIKIINREERASGSFDSEVDNMEREKLIFFVYFCICNKVLSRIANVLIVRFICISNETDS